jgi:hypothetical protein
MGFQDGSHDSQPQAGSTGASAAGGQFGPGGPGGMGGGLMDALHGTIVVNDNGSYVTEAIRTGTVTAISATSIMVASTDGFTKSYVIGPSTQVDNGTDKITSVSDGRPVNITATVSSDTATATEIRDQSLDSAGGQQQGGIPGQQQNGQPGFSDVGRQGLEP